MFGRWRHGSWVCCQASPRSRGSKRRSAPLRISDSASGHAPIYLTLPGYRRAKDRRQAGTGQNKRSSDAGRADATSAGLGTSYPTKPTPASEHCRGCFRPVGLPHSPRRSLRGVGPRGHVAYAASPAACRGQTAAASVPPVVALRGDLACDIVRHTSGRRTACSARPEAQVEADLCLAGLFKIDDFQTIPYPDLHYAATTSRPGTWRQSAGRPGGAGTGPVDYPSQPLRLAAPRATISRRRPVLERPSIPHFVVTRWPVYRRWRTAVTSTRCKSSRHQGRGRHYVTDTIAMNRSHDVRVADLQAFPDLAIPPSGQRRCPCAVHGGVGRFHRYRDPNSPGWFQRTSLESNVGPWADRFLHYYRYHNRTRQSATRRKTDHWHGPARRRTEAIRSSPRRRRRQPIAIMALVLRTILS